MAMFAIGYFGLIEALQLDQAKLGDLLAAIENRYLDITAITAISASSMRCN